MLKWEGLRHTEESVTLEHTPSPSQWLRGAKVYFFLVLLSIRDLAKRRSLSPGNCQSRHKGTHGKSSVRKSRLSLLLTFISQSQSRGRA